MKVKSTVKFKISKDLVLIIILIPILLWGALFISSRFDSKLPSYSVTNKSITGNSVFFEALQELKLPVESSTKPIELSRVGDIQLVPQGGSFNIEKEEIKKWVEEGGTLVYLEPGDFHILKYEGLPEIKGKLFIYKYKKGKVIVANATKFTNKSLVKNRKDAYELIKELENCTYSKIYFNEFYLYEKVQKASLWDFIPLWMKFIIYQILIVLIATFYYKGKRFGKPIPLYEEEERIENEYLYSAAALYKHVKCYDLILEVYYKNFLSKINSTHEEWIEFWEKEDLPSINKAKRIYEFVENRSAKIKKKEYIQAITIIEHLKSILNQRRDKYWITLKKTL